MKVKTAVIPVAGYGTRRLPITKAIEKCMLPIGNRPIVDYVVADCATAGIERIIFVIGEGSTQVQQYYGENKRLEEYLEERDKQAELDIIRGTGHGLTFEYVVQPAGRYGTAIPLAMAAPLLAGESQFAVLGGDDFIYNFHDQSEYTRALKVWEQEATNHLLLASTVTGDRAFRYGILDRDDDHRLVNIIEKPEKWDKPTAEINLSKYLFSSSILDYLDEYLEGGHRKQDEYYITDVISMAHDSGESMYVLPVQGKHLDGGTMEGWLQANAIVLA